MRKAGIFVLGLGLAACLAATQFTADEIAQRPKWEEYLADASVKSERQIESREAVTHPWIVNLEKDGLAHRAVWKDAEGRMSGWLENWRWEIAAYRMDKLLGLNMISPTVERRLHGKRGSIQLWADSEMSLKTKNQKKIPVPPGLTTVLYNRAIYLHRAFDNLIANEDRHANNVLITKDWRIVLIDHSRSFRTSGNFVKQLIYTEKHREGPKPMSALPAPFWEKIQGLTFEGVREAVGEYLTDEEIKAVLLRRDLIVKEINRLIEKDGKSQVLY